jgi:hypothetical protein
MYIRWEGEIAARPVPGGFHHAYYRQAAQISQVLSSCCFSMRCPIRKETCESRSLHKIWTTGGPSTRRYLWRLRDLVVHDDFGVHLTLGSVFALQEKHLVG